MNYISDDEYIKNKKKNFKKVKKNEKREKKNQSNEKGFCTSLSRLH
jgi:hypothetical protein